MRRYVFTVNLRDEPHVVDAYLRHHREVWPEVQASLRAGSLQTIDCRTVIDGLRVRRAGEINFSVVQRYVDDIVALPDKDIFDAMLWVMERCKLVVEGAAAAPVGALLHELVKLPRGSRVAVVLSGGNVNLDQLRGLKWN